MELELLVGMQCLHPGQEDILRFFFVFDTRISRAYRGAHRLIVESHAFRALLRHYVTEILGEGRIRLPIEFIFFASRENCLIRAFRLASTAINAFVVDLK
jgi:hypothetical protein